VSSYQHFECEGTLILQNIQNYSPIDIASFPRRLESFKTLPQEPQVTHALVLCSMTQVEY